MLQLLSGFFDVPFRWRSARLLKNLLYLFLLTKCVYWLVHYDILFGRDALAYIRPAAYSGFRDLALLMYNSATVNLSAYVIISIIIMTMVNLVVRSYFFVDLLIWFFVLNLCYKIYPSLTAGDFMFLQLLLIGSFLLSSDADEDGRVIRPVRNLLHNLAVIALILQISIAYFISGLTKLFDPEWMSGRAVSQILEVRHYSLFQGFALPSFISAALCYAVTFYQLLFPCLIWVPRIKTAVLAAGIVMHLFIAFVMGLTGFGVVMILPYIFLWPGSDANDQKSLPLPDVHK